MQDFYSSCSGISFTARYLWPAHTWTINNSVFFLALRRRWSRLADFPWIRHSAVAVWTVFLLYIQIIHKLRGHRGPGSVLTSVFLIASSYHKTTDVPVLHPTITVCQIQPLNLLYVYRNILVCVRMRLLFNDSTTHHILLLYFAWLPPLLLQ